jgi:hypothetical protein
VGAGKVRESDCSLNAEAQQRREIARLQHKALMLKAELERTTGKPLELPLKIDIVWLRKSRESNPIVSARSACSILQSWLRQIKSPIRRNIISAR